MTTAQPGFNTLQEIQSQPSVWEKSLQHLKSKDRGTFPTFSDYDQVVFTGCGSTYYLSLWAARTCEAATGVTCRAVPASELLLHPQAWLHPGGKSLLVAVSRSAETTETLLALKAFLAGRQGEAIVVTCYPEHALAQLTPWVVEVPEAQEQSVAQTRSFTSMMLAVAWLISGVIRPELPAQVSRAGQELLSAYTPLARQLGTDQKLSRFFFLGSGALYGLACEAMLKMKEMSLVNSESFHVLEFRHGPMSLVDQDSLVIGLIDETSRDYESAVIKEMSLKGARSLGILDQNDPLTANEFDSQVLIPRTLPGQWRAPLYLPILQLIAYERAIRKGLDPDHPTNLTSVVVLHA